MGKDKKGLQTIKCVDGEVLQGVDLIICDTYGHLLDGDRKLHFKSKEDRDGHITRVQNEIKNLLGVLKKGEQTGAVLVGVDVFSFSSLGEDLFKKENAKRALAWTRDIPINVKGYEDNSRSYFMWGISGRGWIFNLQGEEKFFRGEFLEEEGKYTTALDVVRDMVRRFTTEGGKVLEVDLGMDSVVKEAVELEGREYCRVEARSNVGIK